MTKNKFYSISVAVPALLLASCSADYGDKVDHLEEIAQRGVEVHKILEDLEGGEATEEACLEANKVLNNDSPDDLNFTQEEWETWDNLTEQVFVSACKSGKY